MTDQGKVGDLLEIAPVGRAVERVTDSVCSAAADYGFTNASGGDEPENLVERLTGS
jgi:hypothetical protein